MLAQIGTMAVNAAMLYYTAVSVVLSTVVPVQDSHPPCATGRMACRTRIRDRCTTST